MTKKKIWTIVGISVLVFVLLVVIGLFIQKGDQKKYNEVMDKKIDTLTNGFKLRFNYCDSNSKGQVYVDEYMYLPRGIDMHVFDPKTQIRDDIVVNIKYEVDESLFEYVGVFCPTEDKLGITTDKENVGYDKDSYKYQASITGFGQTDGVYKYKVKYPDTAEPSETNIKATISANKAENGYTYSKNAETKITLDNQTNQNLRKKYTYHLSPTNDFGNAELKIFENEYKSTYNVMCPFVHLTMGSNSKGEIIFNAFACHFERENGESTVKETQIATIDLTGNKVYSDYDYDKKKYLYSGLELKLYDNNVFTSKELLDSGLFNLSLTTSKAYNELKFVYEYALPKMDDLLKAKGLEKYVSPYSKGVSFNAWISSSDGEL